MPALSERVAKVEEKTSGLSGAMEKMEIGLKEKIKEGMEAMIKLVKDHMENEEADIERKTKAIENLQLQHEEMKTNFTAFKNSFALFEQAFELSQKSHTKWLKIIAALITFFTVLVETGTDQKIISFLKN